MAELARVIVERRRQLKVTQQDLAFSVGVNRRVIGELEHGKSSVRADILLRTIETLGLDLHVEPRA